MTADFVSDTSDPLEPARGAAGARLATGQVGGRRRDPDRRWCSPGCCSSPAARRPGSAVSEPGEFVVTLLDGLTSAGLYFIVASGFTLIFGLMRTVNMAHGALFLLAAYIAIEVQQRMVGKERNITPEDVDMLSWVVPLLVGAAIAAVVGLRHLRGVPALEPGPGAAPGADHVGDLGDPRRPDARPRRRPGAVDVVAGRRHPLRRDLRPALRHQPAVHPRHRPRRRRPAVAVAQPHPDGHRHPRRRRRPVDGAGARHQHRHRVRHHVLRRRRSSPGWAA